MGAIGSVGARGDSYDNPLAETVHGLYKPISSIPPAVAQRGTGRTGNRPLGRLVERTAAALGVPPAQFERTYWSRQSEPPLAA